jgi:type II secretory pathway pseudopilin PulG
MRPAARRALLSSRPPARGQAAFLTLLLVALLAGALVTGLLGGGRTETERDDKTMEALALAREALVGYAVMQSQPGLLPCPDSDNDGSADAPCGPLGTTAIGRLPWRTLGLPDLRDGAGECLWYAVSGNFKNSGLSGPAVVNSDSPATLVITDGSGTPLPSPASPAVAIVFAPGRILPGQDRSAAGASVCGGNNVAANYLEGGNQSAGTTYVAGLPSATYNDRLLPVTHDALFSAVEQRVARSVLGALNSYFQANGYYPPPAVPADATCLGSATLLPAACPSDALPPGGITHPSGRIPNLPLLAPYAGGSDILRGDVPCPSTTYWFQCNGWRELTWMAVSYPCTLPGPCASGDLTVWWRPHGTATSNQRIVVFVAGRALVGDARSTVLDKTTASNYLEPANTGGPNYDKGPLTDTFNDKVLHN